MNTNLQSISSALKDTSRPTKSDSGTPSVVNTPGDSLKDHELDDDYHKQVNGKGEHWGYHLMVDISEGNENIDNEDAIEAFIGDLVTALKMKRLGPPMIIRVNNQEGRGCTGVQVITTSTITFHGDDDEYSAYIDVFSCKVFDPQVALDLIQKYFQPKKMGKFWIYRDAGRWPEK